MCELATSQTLDMIEFRTITLPRRHFELLVRGLAQVDWSAVTDERLKRELVAILTVSGVVGPEQLFFPK